MHCIILYEHIRCVYEMVAIMSCCHGDFGLDNSPSITIFVNLGHFRHFETVTTIRTWIKSHRYWRIL